LRNVLRKDVDGKPVEMLQYNPLVGVIDMPFPLLTCFIERGIQQVQPG
jgi:hypothetical protein